MSIYFPQAAHSAVWPQASSWLQAGWDTLAHTRISCEFCSSQVTQGGRKPQWMEPHPLKTAKPQKWNSPAGLDAIFSSCISSISEWDGGWASTSHQWKRENQPLSQHNSHQANSWFSPNWAWQLKLDENHVVFHPAFQGVSAKSERSTLICARRDFKHKTVPGKSNPLCIPQAHEKISPSRARESWNLL